MSNIEQGQASSAFEPLGLSAFSQLIGPIHVQWDPFPVFEATVREDHCNSMGRAHGGFIASLVDIATGQGVKRILADDRSLVTVRTNIEYLGAARLGDRLRLDVTLEKDSPSLVFARCVAGTGTKPVASASVVFSARPKPPTAEGSFVGQGRSDPPT